MMMKMMKMITVCPYSIMLCRWPWFCLWPPVSSCHSCLWEDVQLSGFFFFCPVSVKLHSSSDSDHSKKKKKLFSFLFSCRDFCQVLHSRPTVCTVYTGRRRTPLCIMWSIHSNHTNSCWSFFFFFFFVVHSTVHCVFEKVFFAGVRITVLVVNLKFSTVNKDTNDHLIHITSLFMCFYRRTWMFPRGVRGVKGPPVGRRISWCVLGCFFFNTNSLENCNKNIWRTFNGEKIQKHLKYLMWYLWPLYSTRIWTTVC